MDLHWIDATATDQELSAVDAVLGSQERSDIPGASLEEHITHGGRKLSEEKRHLLLPALHGVQERIGWISKGALNYICRRLLVPPAEAYGVASFYALLSSEPRPKRFAHVCDDIACKLQGTDALCSELERSLDADAWHRSPCLGQCERGPAVLFQLAGEDDWVLTEAIAKDVADVLKGRSSKSAPPPTRCKTRGALLARVGVADPEDIDDYRQHGGYQSLRLALALGPEGVLREVKESGLKGRGGAAFPMGIKWEAVAKAPVRPHYVVCNADESEPGTFKDRVLMEDDPFAVVEAMTIAGFVTGSEKGFIYVRGEYPLAAMRLQKAIETATKRSFLGVDIMGEGFGFGIEIRKGAGAYICGEETALFNSIEGFRGEPRNKPPFPTQEGLFGKPTVVNNVETLTNVLSIVRDGGPAFSKAGTNDSTGSKLFCLSGHVAKPGLYEVPFGTTLAELLEKAGGVAGGRELQTILLGGAAGSFVGPDELEVPLTFEGTRAIGASLGSGVVMVFDDGVDMRPILHRVAQFFRDESCGQCVPCRVGTVRVEESLQRLARNGNGEREAELIDELARVMRDASICGLGQTAVTAIQSALERGLLRNGDQTS
jgi:NADH-quinone oxidoreductase subunit F